MTEFKFIPKDDQWMDYEKREANESFSLEIAYQLRRIADALDYANK